MALFGLVSCAPYGASAHHAPVLRAWELNDQSRKRCPRANLRIGSRHCVPAPSQREVERDPLIDPLTPHRNQVALR